MLYFSPEDHSYHFLPQALAENPLLNQYADRRWCSATTLCGFFSKPFDAKKASASTVRKPESKWYGMKPALVRDIWEKEGDRSQKLGNWLHDRNERAMLDAGTLIINPTSYCPTTQHLPVWNPQFTEQGYKQALSPQLQPGVYPEHLMYLITEGVCGQSDVVMRDHYGRLIIEDYKTNKEISTQGYELRDGSRNRMQGPLAHLEDCHLMHYSLQLSLYMYMALRYNRDCRPGAITLLHTLFEIESTDQYGYPVLRRTEDGGYIVRDVVPYKLDYLEREVKIMLAVLAQHRDAILAAKH